MGLLSKYRRWKKFNQLVRLVHIRKMCLKYHNMRDLFDFPVGVWTYKKGYHGIFKKRMLKLTTKQYAKIYFFGDTNLECYEQAVKWLYKMSSRKLRGK